MMQKMSISVFLAAQVVMTWASPVYDQLADEIPLDDEFKSDYDAFKHFGSKTESLLKNLEQKPVPLSLTLNEHLENTFEHNLISPKVPETYPPIKSTIRYTNTPLETYEVKEEVYEPKPIPQLSLTKPVLSKESYVLGSGSLGVVSLGDGKYALGSGSLGYAKSTANSQSGKADIGGGLHVVQAPHLGSSEAFDAAFNNFDFKPLSDFFGHE